MGRKSDPRPERPTVTRYVSADGRRCRRDAPGARKVTKTTESYFVRLKNSQTGKREWIALETTELGQAWTALGELLQKRARQEAGIDTSIVLQSARPLADHIDDWCAQLRAGGRTSEEQVKLLRSRVLWLASKAGWQRLPHITRDSCVKALASLQGERARGMAAGYAGRSAQTRNHYLRAIKQFCAWCVEESPQRLERSPVAIIGLVNVEVDQRHARRSPSDAEVALLMAYLEGQLVPEGASRALVPIITRTMTGSQRALGYRVAMVTGLRAGELRQVEPVHFDLAKGTLTCRARTGKNRKLATLHLPAWLVEEVRAWLASGGALWSRFPRNHPGQVLEADLIAAGVAPVVEAPEGPLHFDFHSLRHWYVTWAANQPDISPKVLQEIVRHSDPRLTMGVYARKANEGEARKIAGKLQRPGGAPAQPPAQPAPPAGPVWDGQG